MESTMDGQWESLRDGPEMGQRWANIGGRGKLTGGWGSAGLALDSPVSG